MVWHGVAVDHTVTHNVNMDTKVSEWSTFQNGPFTIEIELTTEELNTIHATVGGDCYQDLYIQGQLEDGYYSDLVVWCDIELNPEYFEITEEQTIWNNQTITTYEPYYQQITPYKVHKVGMVLGSVLIIGIGWIASPWGNVLNGILTINKFQGGRRRR